MPKTAVIIFAEKDASAPLLEWLDEQTPKVPDKEINQAIRNKAKFDADPDTHTYWE